mmetsp:Transcript_6287/g.9503  ORF Transcript_6287/g.9503 Transcript_6287/m.9503 type:complete len:131 (-) Transcript_6287:13-405(-)
MSPESNGHIGVVRRYLCGYESSVSIDQWKCTWKKKARKATVSIVIGCIFFGGGCNGRSSSCIHNSFRLFQGWMGWKNWIVCIRWYLGVSRVLGRGRVHEPKTKVMFEENKSAASIHESKTKVIFRKASAI